MINDAITFAKELRFARSICDDKIGIPEFENKAVTVETVERKSK
jgi:hypothetical protein